MSVAVIPFQKLSCRSLVDLPDLAVPGIYRKEYFQMGKQSLFHHLPLPLPSVTCDDERIHSVVRFGQEDAVCRHFRLPDSLFRAAGFNLQGKYHPFMMPVWRSHAYHIEAATHLDRIYESLVFQEYLYIFKQVHFVIMFIQ